MWTVIVRHRALADDSLFVSAMSISSNVLVALLLTIVQIDTYCCLCTNMLSEVLLFLSQYLTLCGDIQLMLAQNANNRAAHLEEFNYQTKEDQEILHSLHRESSCQGMQTSLGHSGIICSLMPVYVCSKSAFWLTILYHF